MRCFSEVRLPHPGVGEIATDAIPSRAVDRTIIEIILPFTSLHNDLPSCDMLKDAASGNCGMSQFWSFFCNSFSPVVIIPVFKIHWKIKFSPRPVLIILPKMDCLLFFKSCIHLLSNLLSLNKQGVARIFDDLF